MTDTKGQARGLPDHREEPTPSYRGEDRRQRHVGDERRLAAGFWSALGGLLAIWLLVTLGPGLGAATAVVDDGLLRALLDAAAATLAALVGVLCLMRWRLGGEAASVWLAGAFLLYAVVTIALATLSPLLLPDAVDAQVVSWLRPASRITMAALMLTAALWPPVDSRVRLWHVLAGAAGTTALLTVLFQLLPGVGIMTRGAQDLLAEPDIPVWSSLTWTVVWGGLVLVYLVQATRRRSSLLWWMALLFLGLGLAESSWALASSPADVWAAGGPVLRIVGLCCAVAGATHELQRVFVDQRGDLLRSLVSVRTAEARIRAGREEMEERVHEARNALGAIEGATKTLERYRDKLDPETRATLESAIVGEIARLQRLIATDRDAEGRGLFGVDSALAPVVTGARAQGAVIMTDVAEGLEAFGRSADTAEVVQNLLENARRHAPGSQVVVRGRLEGDVVLIRVEDRGPGVPENQRASIFRRGVRGTTTPMPGSGLGLYVASRLMLEQDGDLWVEQRPGGGAAFVLSLPAPPGFEGGGGSDGLTSAGDAGGRPVSGDDVTQLVEPANVDRVGSGGGDDTGGAGTRAVRDADHHRYRERGG